MTDSEPTEPAGPVVAITGAGRGIGRAIALAFAETGARLVLAARTEHELERTRELVAERAEAIVVPTDVTDPEQTTSMARAARAVFGVIDVLVCNSGIAGPTAPLWEIEPEQWRETMRVNFEGVYLCCRAVLPAMLDRGAGSIVVIGSMTGKRPLHGRTPYSASKLALVGLVRTLSWETGPHGIRVNLISPGGVSGPRIDAVITNQATALGISRGRLARPLHRLVAHGPSDRGRRGGGRRRVPHLPGRDGGHRRGPQRLRWRRQFLSSAEPGHAVMGVCAPSSSPRRASAAPTRGSRTDAGRRAAGRTHLHELLDLQPAARQPARLPAARIRHPRSP